MFSLMACRVLNWHARMLVVAGHKLIDAEVVAVGQVLYSAFL
jgi:hypothetical protein